MIDFHTAVLKALAGQQPDLTEDPTLDDIAAWIRSDFTFVNVQNGESIPDHISYISDRFLDVAKRGATAIAETTLGETGPLPNGMSWRSKSIAEASKAGYTSVFSPFSGEVHPCFHSLGRDWLIVREGAEICMASKMGAVMCDVHLETAWIFPKDKLVVRVTSGYANENVVLDLATEFNFILKYHNDVATYLKRPMGAQGDGLIVGDFWCPHIAHNLWNVQTAWFNIFRDVESGSLKRFINFNRQNFFGTISDLYGVSEDDIQYIDTEEDSFVASLRMGGVFLGVKDEIFCAEFSEKLISYAQSQCSAEFLAELKALRENHFPIIVSTIRLENRAWIEQVEGYASVFHGILGAHPKAAFVLDGLSSDTIKGWTTSWMSLEDELQTSREIVKRLTELSYPDKPKVIMAVGRVFFEAFLLCNAASCFIAPAGSGMMLYKWISNLPGIAFSNSTALDEVNGEWHLRVWHNPAYRYDVVPTVHLPSKAVTDEPFNEERPKSRANFHLDWRDLLTPSLLMLHDLERTETA